MSRYLVPLVVTAALSACAGGFTFHSNISGSSSASSDTKQPPPPPAAQAEPPAKPAVVVPEPSLVIPDDAERPLPPAAQPEPPAKPAVVVPVLSLALPDDDRAMVSLIVDLPEGTPPQGVPVEIKATRKRTVKAAIYGDGAFINNSPSFDTGMVRPGEPWTVMVGASTPGVRAMVVAFDSQTGRVSPKDVFLPPASDAPLQARALVAHSPVMHTWGSPFLQSDLSMELAAFAGELFQAVVLDNLRSHHAAEVKELAKAAKVILIGFPPYSPDLNPIEEAWSKFKAWLRKCRARAAEAFKSAVEEGLDRITPRDVLGWTKHAGYRTGGST